MCVLSCEKRLVRAKTYRARCTPAEHECTPSWAARKMHLPLATTQGEIMTRTTCAVIAALSVASIHCASHPPPTDDLASAIAAVRGAQEAGAAEVPRAALQLKL